MMDFSKLPVGTEVFVLEEQGTLARKGTYLGEELYGFVKIQLPNGQFLFGKQSVFIRYDQRSVLRPIIEIDEYRSHKRNGGFAANTYVHSRFDVLIANTDKTPPGPIHLKTFSMESPGDGVRSAVKENAIHFAREVAQLIDAVVFLKVYCEKTTTRWELESSPKEIEI